MTTHHDGLSGTEKQAVADDYAERMAEGEIETRNMMAQVGTAVQSDGTSTSSQQVFSTGF